MATLQENIEIIKSSVNRMKEALGVELTTSLEELTVAVEENSGSSGLDFTDFESYTALLYKHLCSGYIDGIGTIKLYRTTQTESIGLYKCFELSPKGEYIRRAIDVYDKGTPEDATNSADSMKEQYKYYTNIYDINSQGKFVFMDHNQNSEIGKTVTAWAEGISFLTPTEVTTPLVRILSDLELIQETINALYCTPNKLVWNNGGMYKIVAYYEGNTITGMSNYYTYSDDATTQSNYEKAKEFYNGNETIKDVIKYNNYVVVIFNENEYGKYTVETLQNRFSNLSPVYQ